MDLSILILMIPVIGLVNSYFVISLTKKRINNYKQYSKEVDERIKELINELN